MRVGKPVYKICPLAVLYTFAFVVGPWTPSQVANMEDHKKENIFPKNAFSPMVADLRRQVAPLVFNKFMTTQILK